MKTQALKMVAATAALFAVLGFCEYLYSQDSSFDNLRLRGIGADRASLDTQTLRRRTELMVESQYYVVLRDPHAIPGAIRIQSQKLDAIFAEAARKNGVSKSTLEALAYLESWGDADAKSPSGPVGIMQFTAGTAKDEGLVIRKEKQKVQVQSGVDKGTKRPKFKTKTVEVVVRDDRLDPELAINAAARRLARMTRYLGGEDLAIANHHCGPGRMLNLIGAYIKDINPKEQKVKENNVGEVVSKYEITFSKIFFENSPNFHRDVFKKIREFMEKDQCPTYFFRIQAAEKLLDIHLRNPAEFSRLSKEWENKSDSQVRAPNRIWAWLGPADLKYKTLDDIKAATRSKELVSPPSHRDFGYQLRSSGKESIAEKDPANREFYMQDSPEAVGALTYLAYEVRRLEGAKFKPLDVTSLVRDLEYQASLSTSNVNARTALPTHCTGQAFDVSYKKRSGGEKDNLEFILEDMLHSGMVSFYEESLASKTFHVVPAPKYKDFFVNIYQSAMSMPSLPSLPQQTKRR